MQRSTLPTEPLPEHGQGKRRADSGRGAPAMVPFQTSAKDAMPALSPDSSGARGTATSSTLPAIVTLARAPGSCRSPLHAQQGATYTRCNLPTGI